MKEYVCSICGYIYEESKGIPEDGIQPATAWDDLPKEWVCPLCGATKEEFDVQGEETTTQVESKPRTIIDVPEERKELTPLEMSILCTNLARGCEKQYKLEEEALFKELAIYFKRVTAPAVKPEFKQLLDLIESDLKEGFPSVRGVAKENKDRGALRALTWSEKVTRILNGILSRYEKDGDVMLENTGVYVCTICGFIYVGDALPEICPICKVPNWKFEKMEGGNLHD